MRCLILRCLSGAVRTSTVKYKQAGEIPDEGEPRRTKGARRENPAAAVDRIAPYQRDRGRWRRCRRGNLSRARRR